MIENEREEEPKNIIEEVKKENKIKNKLKKVGIDNRPTLQELNEGRITRKKNIDFKKLNKGN
jgi:hypothetical protein